MFFQSFDQEIIDVFYQVSGIHYKSGCDHCIWEQLLGHHVGQLLVISNEFMEFLDYRMSGMENINIIVLAFLFLECWFRLHDFSGLAISNINNQVSAMGIPSFGRPAHPGNSYHWETHYLAGQSQCQNQPQRPLFKPKSRLPDNSIDMASYWIKHI